MNYNNPFNTQMMSEKFYNKVSQNKTEHSKNFSCCERSKVYLPRKEPKRRNCAGKAKQKT